MADEQREPESGYMHVAVVVSCAVDDAAMDAELFRTYAAIATYASKRNERWCWPSQVTLARRLGVSRQTMSARLHRLAALGYIDMRRARRADGGEDTASYRLVLDFELPPERDRARTGQRPRAGIGGRPSHRPHAAAAGAPVNSEVNPPRQPESLPPQPTLGVGVGRQPQGLHKYGNGRRRTEDGEMKRARAAQSPETSASAVTPDPDLPLASLALPSEPPPPPGTWAHLGFWTREHVPGSWGRGTSKTSEILIRYRAWCAEHGVVCRV